MKRILVLLLITLLLISCEKNEEKVIKVGAILPLSGDASIYGKSMKTGMDLALKEWNNQPNSILKYSIIYEDSKADPAQAVSSFQKLMTLDKVYAVLGPFTSSEVLAVAPIAEKNKLVLLAPTATAPSISNAGDYIFRIVPSDNYDGSVLAKFVYNKLGLKKVAALFINNDYGLGVTDAFKTKFTSLGGTLISNESFAAGNTDFRSILAKLKNKNPEGVFLVGLKEMGSVLKQANEIGFRTQFFSTGLMESNDILKIAGKSANGVYYSYPSFQTENPDSTTKKFISAFERTYQARPDVLAAFGYDAVNILFTAIKNDDKDSIKTNLYKIKKYKGVTGEMTFDKNGDVEKTFGIKKIENGKFVWYLYSFN